MVRHNGLCCQVVNTISEAGHSNKRTVRLGNNLDSKQWTMSSAHWTVFTVNTLKHAVTNNYDSVFWASLALQDTPRFLWENPRPLPGRSGQFPIANPVGTINLTWIFIIPLSTSWPEVLCFCPVCGTPVSPSSKDTFLKRNPRESGTLQKPTASSFLQNCQTELVN